MDRADSDQVFESSIKPANSDLILNVSAGVNNNPGRASDVNYEKA